MTYVYDGTRNASELVILDASRFKKPPVARIEMPQRIPFGFHGNWYRGRGLNQSRPPCAAACRGSRSGP